MKTTRTGFRWFIAVFFMSIIVLSFLTGGLTGLSPGHCQSDAKSVSRSFMYVLSGYEDTPNLMDKINSTPSDVLVVDAYKTTPDNAFTSAEVGQFKEKHGTVLAYMSIGESEDYRSYWNTEWKDNPPSWMGKVNPEWGSNKVKYWDPGWQKMVFDYVEKIAKQGFDGTYLDIVDAYEYWSDSENGENVVLATDDAAKKMITFIGEIRKRARAINPNFKIYPQNAPELVKYPGYLDVMDGIGKEDTWFNGYNDMTNPDSKAAKVDAASLQEQLEYLRKIRDAGKDVAVVDYFSKLQGKEAEEFRKLAEAEGFAVSAADSRELNDLSSYNAVKQAGQRELPKPVVEEIKDVKGNVIGTKTTETFQVDARGNPIKQKATTRDAKGNILKIDEVMNVKYDSLGNLLEKKTVNYDGQLKRTGAVTVRNSNINTFRQPVKVEMVKYDASNKVIGRWETVNGDFNNRGYPQRVTDKTYEFDKSTGKFVYKGMRLVETRFGENGLPAMQKISSYTASGKLFSTRTITSNFSQVGSKPFEPIKEPPPKPEPMPKEKIYNHQKLNGLTFEFYDDGSGRKTAFVRVKNPDNFEYKVSPIYAGGEWRVSSYERLSKSIMKTNPPKRGAQHFGFTYDDMGRIASKEIKEGVATMLTGKGGRIEWQLNQVNLTRKMTYTYDKEGNQTETEVQAYQNGSKKQIVTVRDTEDKLKSRMETLAQNINKKDYAGKVTVRMWEVNEKTGNYLYKGQRVIETEFGENGLPVKQILSFYDVRNMPVSRETITSNFIPVGPKPLETTSWPELEPKLKQPKPINGIIFSVRKDSSGKYVFSGSSMSDSDRGSIDRESIKGTVGADGVVRIMEYKKINKYLIPPIAIKPGGKMPNFPSSGSETVTIPKHDKYGNPLVIDREMTTRYTGDMGTQTILSHIEYKRDDKGNVLEEVETRKTKEGVNLGTVKKTYLEGGIVKISGSFGQYPRQEPKEDTEVIKDENGNLIMTKKVETKASDSRGNPLQQSISFLDNAGKRMLRIEATMSNYDSLGNARAQQLNIYQYDASGSEMYAGKKDIQYAAFNVNGKSLEKTVRSYNAQNQLAGMEKISSTYDAESRLTGTNVQNYDNVGKLTGVRKISMQYSKDGVLQSVKETLMGPNGQVKEVIERSVKASRGVKLLDRTAELLDYAGGRVKGIGSALSDTIMRRVYDSTGKLLKTVEKTDLKYDSIGNALVENVKTVYPDGTVVRMQVQNENINSIGMPSRVTRKVLDENGKYLGSQRIENLKYDSKGNILNQRISNYDENNMLVSRLDIAYSNYTSEGRPVTAVIAVYDDKNMLLEKQTMEFGEGYSDIADRYLPDLGKKPGIELPKPVVEEIKDAKGNVVKIKTTETFEVDSRGNPIKQKATTRDLKGNVLLTEEIVNAVFDSRGNVLSQKIVWKDSSGRVTGMTEIRNSNYNQSANPEKVTRINYDETGKMIDRQEIMNKEFDAEGNVVSQTIKTYDPTGKLIDITEVVNKQPGEKIYNRQTINGITFEFYDDGSRRKTAFVRVIDPGNNEYKASAVFVGGKWQVGSYEKLNMEMDGAAQFTRVQIKYDSKTGRIASQKWVEGSSVIVPGAEDIVKLTRVFTYEYNEKTGGKTETEIATDAKGMSKKYITVYDKDGNIVKDRTEVPIVHPGPVFETYVQEINGIKFTFAVAAPGQKPKVSGQETLKYSCSDIKYGKGPDGKFRVTGYEKGIKTGLEGAVKFVQVKIKYDSAGRVASQRWLEGSRAVVLNPVDKINMTRDFTYTYNENTGEKTETEIATDAKRESKKYITVYDKNGKIVKDRTEVPIEHPGPIEKSYIQELNNVKFSITPLPGKEPPYKIEQVIVDGSIKGERTSAAPVDFWDFKAEKGPDGKYRITHYAMDTAKGIPVKADDPKGKVPAVEYNIAYDDKAGGQVAEVISISKGAWSSGAGPYYYINGFSIQEFRNYADGVVYEQPFFTQATVPYYITKKVTNEYEGNLKKKETIVEKNNGKLMGTITRLYSYKKVAGKDVVEKMIETKEFNDGKVVTETNYYDDGKTSDQTVKVTDKAGKLFLTLIRKYDESGKLIDKQEIRLGVKPVIEPGLGEMESQELKVNGITFVIQRTADGKFNVSTAPTQVIKSLSNIKDPVVGPKGKFLITGFTKETKLPQPRIYVKPGGKMPDYPVLRIEEFKNIEYDAEGNIKSQTVERSSEFKDGRRTKPPSVSEYTYKREANGDVTESEIFTDTKGNKKNLVTVYNADGSIKEHKKPVTAPPSTPIKPPVVPKPVYPKTISINIGNRALDFVVDKEGSVPKYIRPKYDALPGHEYTGFNFSKEKDGSYRLRSFISVNHKQKLAAQHSALKIGDRYRAGEGEPMNYGKVFAQITGRPLPPVKPPVRPPIVNRVSVKIVLDKTEIGFAINEQKGKDVYVVNPHARIAYGEDGKRLFGASLPEFHKRLFTFERQTDGSFKLRKYISYDPHLKRAYEVTVAGKGNVYKDVSKVPVDYKEIWKGKIKYIDKKVVKEPEPKPVDKLPIKPAIKPVILQVGTLQFAVDPETGVGKSHKVPENYEYRDIVAEKDKKDKWRIKEYKEAFKYQKGGTWVYSRIELKYNDAGNLVGQIRETYKDKVHVITYKFDAEGNLVDKTDITEPKPAAPAIAVKTDKAEEDLAAAQEKKHKAIAAVTKAGESGDPEAIKAAQAEYQAAQNAATALHESLAEMRSTLLDGKDAKEEEKPAIVTVKDKWAALVAKKREKLGLEVAVDTYKAGDSIMVDGKEQTVDRSWEGKPKTAHKMIENENGEKIKVNYNDIRYNDEGKRGSYTEEHVRVSDKKVIKTVAKDNIEYKDGKESSWAELVTEKNDTPTIPVTQTMRIVRDGEVVGTGKADVDDKGNVTFSGDKEVTEELSKVRDTAREDGQGISSAMRKNSRSVANTGDKLRAKRDEIKKRSGSLHLDKMIKGARDSDVMKMKEKDKELFKDVKTEDKKKEGQELHGVPVPGK